MPATMPPLGTDPAALEPWIPLLELALPKDQSGYLVSLAWPEPDSDEIELGLLPLNDVHPAEFLDAFDAPPEWRALGIVVRGWASPMEGVRPSKHPARRRVVSTVLLDRSGNLVGRVTGEDGTVFLDEAPTDGELHRLLHEAMGVAVRRPGGHDGL